MASAWGRKETLITPPTVPVYTFTAFGVALMCLCFFAWQRIAFSMPIMQRSYFTEYVRAAVGTAFHQAGEYRLFYLEGAKRRQPRLALPVDLEDGQTTLPNGKTVPVQLTLLPQAQGYRSFGRSLPQKFQDASLYRWLRFTFFKGESVPRLFLTSYIEAGVLLAIMLWFAVPADIKRLKVMKYGRVLRGPEMMSPREFHRAVMREFWRHPLGEFRAWRASKKGGNQAHLGLGFKTTEMTGLMRIPPGKESQHFQMMGDTGAGKTTLIMQLLRQIRDRGDVAIVYDPACGVRAAILRWKTRRHHPQSARRAVPVLVARHGDREQSGSHDYLRVPVPAIGRQLQQFEQGVFLPDARSNLCPPAPRRADAAHAGRVDG